MILFFFFKQKTAYEMRISDWSSDVCPSDLGRDVQIAAYIVREAVFHAYTLPQTRCFRAAQKVIGHIQRGIIRVGILYFQGGGRQVEGIGLVGRVDVECLGRHGLIRVADTFVGRRSEEHTSELQSLMRISYAVFCLKKKKN